MSSFSPRGKSLERMNALHHAQTEQTEQRNSCSSRNAHSQQDDSSYSATDDSDDDNLPLATKGRASLTTRMAITHAGQQSRSRGNVQTLSRSSANKITQLKFLVATKSMLCVEIMQIERRQTMPT